MYSCATLGACCRRRESMSMDSVPPLWRSMMFVPATSEKFVLSAARGHADAVILDLEDSIPEDLKSVARERVATAASKLHGGRHDVLVRINQPLRHATADLEAAVGSHVRGIVLPKTMGAQHLALVDDRISELEEARGLANGATAIVAMVETAAALLRMNEIAAFPRVIAITVGAEDLALSMGMNPTALGLHVPNALAVIAARAVSKLPIGYLGTVAQIDDLVAFRRTISQAREFGFAGGMCIHPAQVEVLNAEFAPTVAEVDAARELVAEYEKSAAAGTGALRHRGKMIDRPIVDRARTLLRLHERIGRNQH
jgi:citrate lyase subunit beta / citryl-CoA lyase